MDTDTDNLYALTQLELERKKYLNPDKKYKMLKNDGTWVKLGRLIYISFNQPSYQNGGISSWSIRFKILPEGTEFGFNINSSDTHIFEDE